VLNVEQIKSLLEHLTEPGKIAVLLDILTGLRVSELLALRWSDVDFENLVLHVTESSRSPISTSAPSRRRHRRSRSRLDPELAEALLMWRR
jgi:integrase